MQLSEIAVSLLLFSIVVGGPILYYSSLMTGVQERYGTTMSASSDTAAFNVTNTLIAKITELQANTQRMSSGNTFTDFVNMITSGLGVLAMFWELPGLFQNIINTFLDITGLNAGGWIGAAIMGIIGLIITIKIISIALSKDV